MNNKPLFSIVIANYNHGSFIEQAIQSVLCQSYKNYELIVVDGNSSDSSVEIIKKYDDNISWWVSEPDSGQSEAFNKGFKMAKGKYFFWLNADDVLINGALQSAANYLKTRPKVEWISANTVFFDVTGKITKCTNGPSWSDFLFKNAPLLIYGPTSIFSREIFIETGGFDESLHFGMDTDLWLRFKCKGYRFEKIKKYFWGFRIHQDSKTSHSFSEVPSEEYRSERQVVMLKNSLSYSDVKLIFQKIHKLTSGLYLKSFFATKKYSGKNIKNVQF